jgi:hypothetical protein
MVNNSRDSAGCDGQQRANEKNLESVMIARVRAEGPALGAQELRIFEARRVES